MYEVFIGSSSEGRAAAEEIAIGLEKSGLLRCLRWWDSRTFPANFSFLESLFNVLVKVDFAIFIATPDDLLEKRGRKSQTLRDNVLFEYGLFAGHLGRGNAILVPIGEQELPSDLTGISLIRANFLDGVASQSDEVKFGKLIDELLEELLCANQSAPFLDIAQVRTSTPNTDCLLYTSPSPRDKRQSRMPSSA